MNTIVNFDLAKPLKGKGFNEPCNDAYNSRGCKYSDGWCEYIDDNDIGVPFRSSELKENDVAAPTIADVVMWFYKEHEIWIGVNQYARTGFYSMTTGNTTDGQPIRSHIYDTPSEAYETAIKYVLNNLL